MALQKNCYLRVNCFTNQFLCYKNSNTKLAINFSYLEVFVFSNDYQNFNGQENCFLRISIQKLKNYLNPFAKIPIDINFSMIIQTNAIFLGMKNQFLDFDNRVGFGMGFFRIPNPDSRIRYREFLIPLKI